MTLGRFVAILFVCGCSGSSAGPVAGTGGGAAAVSGPGGTSSGAGAVAAGGGAGGTAGGAGAAAAGGGAGGTAGLRWYMTCGDPVCRNDTTPFDDPSIPNCTADQTIGASCSTSGQLCDGVASCGAKLACAASDPTMRPGGCPISRARYKQQISYLTPEQRRTYHEALLRIPLAAYQYKHAPEAGPQLGFVIEDIEPSVAVSGDHVNLYGYVSMAVAAIQEQQKQIDSLQRELKTLRAQPRCSCDP